MKKSIVTVFALAACLVACNKAEKVAPVPDVNRPISFTATNLCTMVTKATPIADGTLVGVYAGAPVSQDNVSLTVSMEPSATSGTLTPTVTNSLLWAVGQTTQATNFLAVYPYESVRPLVGGLEEADKYIEYSIASTDDVAYANEFLAAAASQAPGTGETPAKVALAFKHPFAKLVYNITNTSDDFVAGATISGIRREGRLMFISGAVAPFGEAVPASAPVDLNVNGDNSFMTIVMPEASAINPVVTVNMVSGAQYIFQLSAAAVLEAGKVYTASIIIDGSHGGQTSDRTVMGTFTVTDWVNVDAGSMAAGGSTPAAKWWYLVGNIDEIPGTADGDWGKYIPFRCISATTWQVDFYYAGTATDYSQGFKLIHAATLPDWSEAYGMSPSNHWVIEAQYVQTEDDDPSDDYRVHSLTIDGGYNIPIDTPGKYRIKFQPADKQFYIYKIN